LAVSARRPPVPEYRPQLAQLVKAPPTGDQWIHEPKLDGYRIGCRIEGGAVTLLSRRGNDWTDAFPEVVGGAKRLKTKAALLDGEVAALLPDGRTSFQMMQGRGNGRATIAYFVFDLLHVDGEDLFDATVEQRKARLRALLGATPPPPLRFVEHVVGTGPEFFAAACGLRLEGIVSKSRSDPYRQAARHASWQKTKCLLRQELVVGGWMKSVIGGLGALLLGYYDEQGRLVYAGKVGTGFQRVEKELLRRLGAEKASAPPFEVNAPRGAPVRDARWIAPRLVVEVAFTEWTDDGHIRHPSFQGVREDKNPQEVVRERALAPTPPPEPPAATPARRARASAVTVADVPISHPDRLIFPDVGLTKADIARYYDRIAERMVPHVADRPLTLLRCDRPIDPDAEKGGCAMIRHAKAWGPAALRRVKIEELHKTGEYLVADDRAGLVSLAQMGVVEIHTWNGRARTPYEHDRVVFDLDPGPDVSWARVVAGAHALRAVLKGQGLRAWVKTTGGKGLHVVAPVEPTTWEACLAFARAMAAEIIAGDPRAYTTAIPKPGREKKILIDILRNNRTNTSVAAFSLRARPKAPVSMPLSWDELTPKVTPEAFTMSTVVDVGGDDPWKDYWRTKQRLPGRR
jgi:bifunctional non-homologous end joining protein LigD